MSITLAFARLLLVALLAVAGQEVRAIQLPGETEFVEISDMAYFHDSVGSHSFAQVKALQKAGAMRPYRKDAHLSGGDTQYWLCFTLENPNPTPGEYLLSFAAWDSIEVFGRAGGIDLTVQRTGSLIHYEQRDFPLYAKMLIRLELAAGADRQIWVRLHQSRERSIPNRGLRVELTSRIYGETLFRWHAMVYWVLLILLGFLFLYNLFTFLSLKVKWYRFYLFIHVLMGLELFLWAGFWGPVCGNWSGISGIEVSSFTGQNWFLPLLLVLCARDFLEPRLYAPKLDQWIFPSAMIAFLLGVLFFWVAAPLVLHRFVLLLNILSLGFILLLNILALNQRHPMAVSTGIMVLVFGGANVLNLLGTTWDILPHAIPYRVLAWIVCDAVLGFAFGREVFGITKANELQEQALIRSLQRTSQLQQEFKRKTLMEQEMVKKELANRLQSELVPELQEIKSTLKGLAVAPFSQFAENSNLMSESLHLLGNISEDLMPVALQDSDGLVPALQHLLGRLSIPIQTSFPPNLHLAEDRRILLYRSIEELVTNILKHAAATHIRLRIQQHDGQLQVLLEDDGQGFDLQTLEKGFGLQQFEHKLRLVQGHMTIDSQPGLGTRTELWMPVVRETEKLSFSNA